MMWDCCVQSGTPMISFDIKNDLVASRKKLGDEAIIVGNYDVFKLPCAEETTVEEMRKVAMDKATEGGFGIDALYWFKTITQKIELLKEVEDSLSRDLSGKTETLLVRANAAKILYLIM